MQRATREAKAKARAEAKIRANRIAPIREVVLMSNEDYPHIRMGGDWKTDNELGVVCEYADQMRSAKISDGNISILLRDLFWACYRELDANGMIIKKSGIKKIAKSKVRK